MPENTLLTVVAICAVLALLMVVWLTVQVVSLRRHRFVSPRLLAGMAADEGPTRRSVSSRQGEQRRYTAPAVRTGVDSLTMKRALERHSSRQQKDIERQAAKQEQMLARMKRDIDEARAALRKDLDGMRHQVGEVTGEFDRVRKQASTDTQSIRKVSADATQTIERMSASVEEADRRLRELDERLTVAQNRLDGHDAGLDEVRTGQRELVDWRAAASEELRAVEERRSRLETDATTDRKRLDTVDRGLGGVAQRVDELSSARADLDGRTTSLAGELATLVGLSQKHGERVDTLEAGATQVTERLGGLDQGVREAADRTDNLNARLKHLEHSSQSALTEVALVRYDAFGDMGGRMSFSVAMLDSVGDGLVITSLNGRSHAQTYAKSVSEGRGLTTLTEEEQQAVTAARGIGPEAQDQAVRPINNRR